MKASLSFYSNELKKNSKTGKIPIFMRICYQRTKAESRLNAEISDLELLKWDPITMCVQERNFALNHYLNRPDQKFNELLFLEATSLPKFNASTIKNQVLLMSIFF